MSKLDFSGITLPANWNPYIALESTVNTDFFKSGAITIMPNTDLTKGSTTINMPFWGAPAASGNQVLSSTGSLSVNKVTSGNVIVPVLGRGDAFSVNRLAAAYAGSDPLGFIQSQLGQYWAEVIQTNYINLLAGAFANSSMSALVSDISGTASNTFTAASFTDAKYKLGDASGQLSLIIAHPDTIASMEKQDLLDKVVLSSGAPAVGVSGQSYRGARIVPCEGLVANAGVYTTYLLAAGSLGFVENTDFSLTEFDRVKLADDNQVIVRRMYGVGLRGVSWLPAGVEGGPTDADLATAANYALKYNKKQVGAVQFKHKLA